jgi:hypothetical protein
MVNSVDPDPVPTGEVILHGRLNAVVRVGLIALEDLPLGHALYWDRDDQLSVDVAEVAEEGNTLPISSAAVHAILGDIDQILQSI